MQKYDLSYTVTPVQRFLIDRCIELLYVNSLDSYRLRLHNPLTLLKELISVGKLTSDGLLTNKVYLKDVSEELKRILNDGNHGFTFTRFSEEYFVKQILSTKDNPKLVLQAARILLSENSDYLSRLFIRIIALSGAYPTFVNEAGEVDRIAYGKCLKELNTLLNHLHVELLARGYSKKYLYDFFQIFFVRKTDPALGFTERINIYQELADKEPENFDLVYSLQGTSFHFGEFRRIDENYQTVDKRFKKSIESHVSRKVSDFLASEQGTLIRIPVRAQDHYKAVEISMEKISKDLDIYHMGFTKEQVQIGKSCAIIGERDQSKANVSPVNFQIDGYIRSNPTVFQLLLDKIRRAEQNGVDERSYDKLLSAIRYFRTGSEAVELETKFLNYWIGLEYIFTSNGDNDPIANMKEHFPVCHSNVYVKRNLLDFHKSIKRQEIHGHIDNYNDDLQYLTKFNSYNKIIQHSVGELPKFRAAHFQAWTSDPSNIHRALDKHSENLKLNLTRLYRIRNEIVHNAAIKKGILVNIAHLRYYFTFILNSILDFMSEQQVDLTNDGKITLEDYFVSQNIIKGWLRKSTISEHVKVENPSDIFF
ncbi:hypothetical protein Dfri01_55820 [Dyadobacter frigoris]|uniref:hypothetical protein n=1 Tax=Dyadobacter frigoris TaxID=2576211 RepID=UPI0024A33255|nr:hypothetical protein [Dyadobacter frigoris]GLU56121.1 hypothetical protein Dfri01_55820 [Dyadobacter frigoris]